MIGKSIENQNKGTHSLGKSRATLGFIGPLWAIKEH